MSQSRIIVRVATDGRAKIVRETRDGRMQEIEIRLSDWVFNALKHNEVLTLSRDYFRLRKPIERRLYEIARKHCGRQQEWRISLGLLQKKCGAVSSEREFRRLVNNIVEEDMAHGHLPDYSVRYDGHDMIVFTNRGTVAKSSVSERIEFRGMISGDAYEEARLVAPEWDVYFLEREWREWITEPPRDIDAAFVGFCRKWNERRGRPR